MSIGKNINVGGGKSSKQEASKVKAVKEEPKKISVEKSESVAEVAKTDAQKMQQINESASGLTTATSGDKIAIQRQEAVKPMVAEGQNMLIVFPVGDEEYAIAIDDIKEVVPMPPVAKIPQVPNYILGVANVRGNVLAVVDLTKKFASGGKDTDSVEGKFVLVIKSEEMQVAVNVITVPNTMIVKDSEIDSPTNVISNSSLGMGHIKGIVKKEKRMIIWIDIHEVMSQMQVVE